MKISGEKLAKAYASYTNPASNAYDPDFVDIINKLAKNGKIHSSWLEPAWMANWRRSVAKIHQFVKQQNKLPNKRSKNPEEANLGQWLQNQMNCYKGNRGRPLTEEQIEIMEAIPSFQWRKFDTWAESYDKKLQYVNKHGLPNNDQWCNSQRERYRRGGMPTEQEQLLNKIPGWYWSKADLWDRTYDKISEMNCPVSKLPTEERAWCTTQRSILKEGKSSRLLTPKRVKKLKALLGWQESHRRTVDERATEYRVFVSSTGKHPRSIRPKNDKDRREISLYGWRNRIESKKERGTATNEELKALKELYRKASRVEHDILC